MAHGRVAERPTDLKFRMTTVEMAAERENQGLEHVLGMWGSLGLLRQETSFLGVPISSSLRGAGAPLSRCQINCWPSAVCYESRSQGVSNVRAAWSQSIMSVSQPDDGNGSG